MNHFNIRVYGIWINHDRHVLVCDEQLKDFEFTKFPGGGLEFGEGMIDCLKREWMEELNMDIEILEHIYTTDFFQISAFNPTSQIISVYYLVKPLHLKDQMITSTKTFNQHFSENEKITFRFLPLKSFSENDVTLPIDKKVAKMIMIM